MKVYVDLDGTISSRPALFSALMKGWMDNGHEVCVLTGTITGDDQVGVQEKELQLGRIEPSFLRGVHFTEIIVVVGYGESVEEKVKGCRRLKGERCFADKATIFIDNDPLAQWEVHRRSPITTVMGMVGV